MLRSDLVVSLCEKNPHMTRLEAENVVTTVFEEISTALSVGRRVEIRGFGSFSVRDREAREGRNPRTGVSVDVEAKKVPHFKPGKELRERLKVLA